MTRTTARCRGIPILRNFFHWDSRFGKAQESFVAKDLYRHCKTHRCTSWCLSLSYWWSKFSVLRLWGFGYYPIPAPWQLSLVRAVFVEQVAWGHYRTNSRRSSRCSIAFRNAPQCCACILVAAWDRFGESKDQCVHCVTLEGPSRFSSWLIQLSLSLSVWASSL